MTQPRWRPHIALGLLLLATALVYWPGLRGPLLLDDYGNLDAVSHYLEGRKTAAAVIFGNTSGPLGRPLSMASFVLDAKLFGNDIRQAKRTSLLIHLLIGVLLYAVFTRLLARDTRLAHTRAWLPLALTAAWLLLPIHVSSVLYLVQRMAMLSALFVVLGLWVFLWSRARIESGQSGGRAGLWVGVPLCTALAVLSKENGALLPLMALAVEVTLFRPAKGARRDPWVVAFFALVVALPAIAVTVALWLWPERLLQYERRHFSLGERLLTQGRILWDYVLAVLVPQGPRLGLFHDHYPKSTGLFQPWTTAAALLAWAATLWTAWRLRFAAPVFTAGILLFLAGHAMESSILPLELYFEHRNYLPSIGLLLALAGLIAWLAARLPAPSPAFRRAAPVLLLAPLAVYAWGTHGRALVWSSESSLYAQELRHNAASPRMRSMLIGNAIRDGAVDSALEHVAAAEPNLPERELATASLWRFAAYCAGDRAAPAALYAELSARLGSRVEYLQVVAWELLANMMANGRCPRLDTAPLIDVAEVWILGTAQAPRDPEVWRSVIALAGARASQERFEEAAALAWRAWRDSGEMPNAAIYAFQLNATIGNVAACEALLTSLEGHYGKGDRRLDGAVENFRQALLDGQIGKN